MKINVGKLVTVWPTDLGYEHLDKVGCDHLYEIDGDKITCPLLTLFKIFPPEEIEDYIEHGDIDVGDPRIFEPGSPGRTKVEC